MLTLGPGCSLIATDRKNEEVDMIGKKTALVALVFMTGLASAPALAQAQEYTDALALQSVFPH